MLCWDVGVFCVWWHQDSQGHADGLVLNKIGHWLCLVAREKVEIGLTQKNLLVVEFGLEAVGTEREYNDFVLQQWKHQRCNSSLWQQITAGLLKRWETPFPGDGYVPSEKGEMEWAHLWLSWGLNELRAHEWETPYACTSSHGQNQAVGAAGCMMAPLCQPDTVTPLCHPSAGIHAPVQLCLKGWNSDPSAE